MKIKNYLYIALMLVFAGCERDTTVPEPEFEVSTEAATYAVGEKVKFNFTGNPDLISFYSGETLNSYAFKDGRVVEGGELKLSFESSVQFGSQANQVSVLYSTDFDGDFTVTDGVFKGADAFKDITSRFKLATNNVYRSSGEVDISDLRVEDKPIYIAFKYNVKNQSPTNQGGFGLGRTWIVRNFSFVSETSIGNLLLGDNATAGFRQIDLKPDIAPMRSTLTAANIRMVAHAANATNISVETANWTISKRFEVGDQDLGPDRPIPVKGMQDGEVTSFSHTYSKPGNYKVYFKAKNATIDDQKEVIREVNLTITP